MLRLEQLFAPSAVRKAQKGVKIVAKWGEVSYCVTQWELLPPVAGSEIFEPHLRSRVALVNVALGSVGPEFWAGQRVSRSR